ncbi:M50 family metallopeptidase [Sedimentibacter sp. zth1]|uniref:M50 family metallopeptidase n=1 Tax=Sedimentibacter sp. zth1 TaxID=2816908 RepID=UPI001A918EFE|nr:M50 family metallopeptidase [Sedimentibacter sp. zth1]QSX06215.1 M50 family metallopeptidase [Sedimentibacter sp. zth1]
MKLKYLLIIYISFILHEIGHFITAHFIGARVVCFKLGLYGVNMQINTNDLSYKKKMLLFFSGPLTNVFIALFAYKYQLVSILEVNMLLAVINLIPVVPLDGGNILKTILEIFLKKKYVCIFNIIINLIFMLIALWCLYKSHSIIYLAIGYIAIKGIITEKNMLLFDKMKNTYKKLIY